MAAYAAQPLTKSSATDETAIDLLQGFLDVRLPLGAEGHATLRGGWDLETNFQIGDFAGGAIRAWSIECATPSKH